MTSSQPAADVSVRTAWSADAPALAAVQVQAWRESYAGLLPAEVLDQLDIDAIAAKWQHSIDKPGDARNRVLVALERTAVRGLAVVGPSADPDADPVSDGELVELLVDPPARGAGHGSRLVQASIDTLRADGFTTARTWVPSDGTELPAFLTAAGWAPDGAGRELDLHGDGSVLVAQVRLHTDLSGTG